MEAFARAWCLMCSDLEGDQAGEDGGAAPAGDGVGTAFSSQTLLGFLKSPFQKPLSWPRPSIIL